MRRGNDHDMAFRDFPRKIVLTIPPVRRLYEYAKTIQSERDALIRDVERLQSELKLAAEAKARAEEQAQEASKQREDVELRLYMLTSDFHRAVNVSEHVRAMLRGTQEELDTLRQNNGKYPPRGGT